MAPQQGWGSGHQFHFQAAPSSRPHWATCGWLTRSCAHRARHVVFLHVKRKINNRFHVVSVSQKWAGQSKISLDVFFLAYLIIAMAAPQPPPTTYLTRTSPWCKEAFAIMHCHHEVWDAKQRGKFPGPNSGLSQRFNNNLRMHYMSR